MTVQPKYYWTKIKNRNHSKMVPDSFRMIITGKSGCGKTSLVMRMLLENGLLDYNKLFIFGRSLHQPEYQILKHGFENQLTKELIVLILKHNKLINNLKDKPENVCKGFACELDDDEKGDISIEMFENGEDIPDPKDFNSNDKNLIIFDDIMCDKKQTPADNFYTRARHNNIDCIYISQNFYKLPRQTIRSNANFMIFFKLSPTDVNHVFYDSDASVDFKKIEGFRQFCNESWSKPYGFIVIDKDNPDIKNRYRNQLEIIEDEPQIVFEKQVTFEDEVKKPRATKLCSNCDIKILSSSMARHLKSKCHSKKLS